MSKETSKQIIDKLQDTIKQVLMPMLPKSGKFALLDFPDHANVGDSAIWLGEIIFFKETLNRSPSYVCTTQNFSIDALKETLPEGPIFIHGGGNFGDVWPAHQKFREQIIQNFPDRKIIQLPQSIHFSDKEELKKTAKIIRSHPDFTLLVRDQKSYSLAKESFGCHVELCPDMAFCIGSINKPVKSSHSLLLLLRTDHESSSTTNHPSKNLPSSAIIADWLNDDPDIQSKIRKLTIKQLIPQLGYKALNKNNRRELLYRRLAENRVNRGLKLLSSAEFIITDRLHTHILSILLKIPHIKLDNNYGKIRNFAEAWTKNLESAYAESNLDSALEHYLKVIKHNTN